MTAAHDSHHARRALPGAAALLLALLAVGSFGAPPAESKVICKTAGFAYPQPKFFYVIGGLNCSKKVFKIAVSGYFFPSNPDDPLIEISKECRNVKSCLYLSSNRKNPAGTQRWRMAFTAGFKEHWYSIPTYKWFNKYFTF